MNDTPRYATLQDYLRVIRERRGTVVVAVVVFAAAALAWTMRQDVRYEATARITPNDISQDVALLGSGSAQERSVAQQAALYASRVRSPEVAREAADRLPGDAAPASLAQDVVARVEASTGFVSVTAGAPTGRRAAAIANAFAEATVAQVTRETRRRFRLAADRLERELRQLSPERRDSVAYAVLQQRQFQLQALARFSRPASVGEAAGVPADPVAPRPVRNTVLGGVLGLLAGLLLAFLRDSLDVKVRQMRQVDDILDLPVVGRVREEVLGKPLVHDGSPADPAGPGAESFSIIGTNLQFLADGAAAPTVVLVTSAVPAEGKSTVSMRLAAAAAAAGRRSLVVEADLRRPSLGERLGIATTPGLSDFLSGQAAPREILRSVRLPVPEGADRGSAPKLVCIPAGSSSHRVAELLTSERFAEFVRQVGEVYDLVVIDSPPMLAVADPLQIIPHADAVVLCVRLGATKRSELEAARAALQQAPAKPTGVVITGIRENAEGDYVGYSYGYAYSQGDGSGRRRLLSR